MEVGVAVASGDTKSQRGARRRCFERVGRRIEGFVGVRGLVEGYLEFYLFGGGWVGGGGGGQLAFGIVPQTDTYCFFYSPKFLLPERASLLRGSSRTYDRLGRP